MALNQCVMSGRAFWVMIVTGLVAMLVSVSTGYAETVPPEIQARIENYETPYEGEYIIGIDDQISVNVWKNAELSVSVPVRPDGRISTPLIGDVQAAGLTPMQLGELIRTKLSDYIREPHVSIIVTGLSSHEYISRVRVIGAVRSPLTVPYRKGMRVLDLVLEAGGPNEFANADDSMLYRKNDDGGMKKIEIDLKKLLEKGDFEHNRILEPGDVIMVPKRLF